MASSPMRLRSKTRYHARSVSFPSRSHPLISQFNDCLLRLELDSEATSYSPNLPSMSNKLSSFENLYDCVDELLHLPHTRQVFSRESHEKWVDQTLEGHLRLLDACNTTKQVFSQTKEDLQEILSVLRRRREADDLYSYSISRTKAKKMIHKSLKRMNCSRHIKRTVVESEKDHETIAIISILREVESVTLNLFESFLSYVAGTNVQSGQSRWSLVSRLMHSKRVLYDEKNLNEFDKVDASLMSLAGTKFTNMERVENVQNELREMESSIQILEEGLECLFKRLIKTRVSLLNMLSH